MNGASRTAGAAPREAPAPPQAVVAIDRLVHRFGARTVLEIVRWSVAPGVHTLVLGPSGCGKSTLLHLIAGLLRPSAGRIVVAGRELGVLGPAALDQLRSRSIGIVLQRLHLIAALSVRDNLRLARSLAGLPAEPARIDALLDQLGLRPLARALPRQLSQGEAQRVAIARALVNRPTLILADEPSAALDDANCAAVTNLLMRQAEASGATLVIATHDRRLAPWFTAQLTLEGGT